MIKLLSQIFNYYTVSISAMPSSERSEQVLLIMGIISVSFCPVRLSCCQCLFSFFTLFFSSMALPSVLSELTGILNVRVAKAGVDFTSVWTLQTLSNPTLTPRIISPDFSLPHKHSFVSMRPHLPLLLSQVHSFLWSLWSHKCAQRGTLFWQSVTQLLGIIQDHFPPSCFTSLKWEVILTQAVNNLEVTVTLQPLPSML